MITFDQLIADMPPDLRQAWHGARVQMGVTRAMELLLATIIYAKGRKLSEVLTHRQGG